MPKVTEAHVEARRHQILEAANVCFARSGFHQTTMQEICRQAELSPGAVYSYFDSKEAIIEASCGANLERTGQLFQEAMQQGDMLTVLDQLVDVFFGMLAEPESDMELCHEVQIWGEVQRNPRLKEIVDGARGSVIGYLEEIVRGAQERGEINPDLDPHSAARVLMSAHDGLVLQRGIDGEVDVWQYTQAFKALYGGEFWQGGKRGRLRADKPSHS